MKNKSALMVFIIMYVIGMILGPLLDGMHVHSKILAYNDPEKFQAGWVPFLFGGAAASIGILLKLVEHFFKQTSFNSTWKQALVSNSTFMTMYALSAYLRFPSWIIFLIITIAALILAYQFIKNKASAVIVLVVTLIGPAVEMFFTGQGFFRYINPDAFGIPLWLYPLYTCAAVAVSHIVVEVYKLRMVSPTSRL